jgi:hypothetical protein
MCCSFANWCGLSDSYCGSGCQSGPCAGNDLGCGDGVCNSSETCLTCPSDCCPFPPYRCSSEFTCEQNGHVGMCCSSGDWCGTSADHCGSGCKNGPCCSDPTNCTGVEFGAGVCGNGLCEGSESCLNCASDCCIEPFRCSALVTCEQNGYPGLCCSANAWCGDSAEHCGAGCQSGPCCADPDNCLGPELG